jgi:hypothetical protein
MAGFEPKTMLTNDIYLFNNLKKNDKVTLQFIRNLDPSLSEDIQKQIKDIIYSKPIDKNGLILKYIETLEGEKKERICSIL